MANPAPGFLKVPDREIQLEAGNRNVRVKFGGEWIAESNEAMVMRETGHLPVYYFPLKDIRFELLHSTPHTTYCPYKGKATYWTIRVGDRESENAVWGYPDPYDEMTKIGLQNYCAFYRDRVDHWYEDNGNNKGV